ncbi:MAG: LAGLIDADG family homing endonuclease [Candidatus Woesearchaeota archaeon]
MRVRIKDPQSFFKELKKDKSLKQFSKEKNIPYSTIKKWHSGANCIDKKVFDRLIKKSRNKERWLKETKILSNTWGQSVGGKTTADKLGRKGLQRKLEKARSYKKNNYGKIKCNFNNNFCEFYRALMGDGCISVYKKQSGYYAYDIIIVGDLIKDKKYYLYLKKLIERELKVRVKIKEIKKSNSRKLTIKCKGLVKYLNGIGFPIGKKGIKLKIPKRMSKLKWRLQRNIMRGLFDMDGSFYAKKHERYKHPYITITSISNILLAQLCKSLRNQGYPVYIRKKTGRVSEIAMRGNKNIVRWMDDIGSNNPRHSLKDGYWKKKRVLPSNTNWAGRLIR